MQTRTNNILRPAFGISAMQILMNSARRRANSRRGRGHRREGAVMVEFAIVAPMLFLFFFTAFEFCRVAMIRHTADNAVYEAARVAVVPGATSGEARAQATSILSSLGLNNVSVNVIPAVIDRRTEEVTVRVQVPIDGNSFVPNQFFGGKTIERELTLQREGIRAGNGSGGGNGVGINSN